MTLNAKYERIYAIHIKQLDLTAHPNNYPSFVVFSAIPGSGKSEISKRLESDYGYLRITNKLIRESIAASGHEDVVIGDYTVWFLDKLTKDYRPNIVFDRNIDQWYKPSKVWAEKNNYNYILVAIDVSTDILKKRLLKREGTTESKAHDMLDFYKNQHVEIRDIITTTISFADDYDLDDASKIISNAGVQ